MPHLSVPKRLLGFTLIEVLVIILIVGILSAISIPSFVNLIDKVNLNNAVSEVRASLQTAQRDAIRKSQICTVGINSLTRTVMSYCTSDNRDLPKNVDFATNIDKDSKLPGNPIRIDFGILGTAEFKTVELEDDTSSNSINRKPKYVEMSLNNFLNQPDDSSGKIVFYVANNSSATKKCIAISNTLGLTRVGNYTGKIKENKLTKKGACTAA